MSTERKPTCRRIEPILRRDSAGHMIEQSCGTCGRDLERMPRSWRHITERIEPMEITTTFTGPECDGEDCDEYQHRAGCSLFDADEVIGPADATIVNYAQDARDAGAIETERDAENAYATVESVAWADGDPMERDPLDRGGAAWADFDPSTDILLPDGRIERERDAGWVESPLTGKVPAWDVIAPDPDAFAFDDDGDPIADRRWAQDRHGPADRRVSGTDRRIAYAVDSIGRGTYGNRGTDGTHKCAEHVSQAPPCDPWRVQDTQAYAMLDADGRAAVDAIARGNEADESPADRFVRYVHDYAAGWISRDTYAREQVLFVTTSRGFVERGQATVGAIVAIGAVLTIAFVGAMVLRSILEAAAAGALR